MTFHPASLMNHVPAPLSFSLYWLDLLLSFVSSVQCCGSIRDILLRIRAADLRIRILLFCQWLTRLQQVFFFKFICLPISS
jgi:hypothetical protein